MLCGCVYPPAFDRSRDGWASVLYAPECVEVELCELRLYAVLRSSLVRHNGLEAAVATRSRSPVLQQQ